VVELNSPIFWETESIRQVNRIESNRFELRIGMHYISEASLFRKSLALILTTQNKQEKIHQKHKNTK